MRSLVSFVLFLMAGPPFTPSKTHFHRHSVARSYAMPVSLYSSPSLRRSAAVPHMRRRPVIRLVTAEAEPARDEPNRICLLLVVSSFLLSFTIVSHQTLLCIFACRPYTFEPLVLENGAVVCGWGAICGRKRGRKVDRWLIDGGGRCSVGG